MGEQPTSETTSENTEVNKFTSEELRCLNIASVAKDFKLFEESFFRRDSFSQPQDNILLIESSREKFQLMEEKNKKELEAVGLAINLNVKNYSGHSLGQESFFSDCLVDIDIASTKDFVVYLSSFDQVPPQKENLISLLELCNILVNNLYTRYDFKNPSDELINLLAVVSIASEKISGMVRKIEQQLSEEEKVFVLNSQDMLTDLAALQKDKIVKEYVALSGFLLLPEQRANQSPEYGPSEIHNMYADDNPEVYRRYTEDVLNILVDCYKNPNSHDLYNKAKDYVVKSFLTAQEEITAWKDTKKSALFLKAINNFMNALREF